jgi:hypothetical protein
MDIDPERPRPVKYSPEIGNPVGHAIRWPLWVFGLFLVLLVAFVGWAQGWWL